VGVQEPAQRCTELGAVGLATGLTGLMRTTIGDAIARESTREIFTKANPRLWEDA
jgi:hypothetical protein